MSTMNNNPNPDPDPDPNQQKKVDEDQEKKEAIMKYFKSKGKDYLANYEFAGALLMLGSSACEKLKRNAYMLSTMANVGGKNDADPDRYVALLVERLTDDDDEIFYQMLDPNETTSKGGSTELIKNLGENINEASYRNVWKMASEAENSVGELNHAYGTAKQYLRVWANFITWSCDFKFSTQKMTLEQVNMLVKTTETNLSPFFNEVKNGQKKDLGMRNFLSHHEKYTGTVHQKLDQLMIEYQHDMVTNANSNENANREKLIVI